MMRWWWFGPAVTKPELEREMRRMKEGGIGGFEVQPVYPLQLDRPARGVRNLPFLSGEFLDALRFTARKARELGLRMDLTLGSGWPYGGPQIPVALAAGRLRSERIPVPPWSREVALPRISEGERFIAAFLASGDRQNVSPGGFRELTTIGEGLVEVPEDLEGPHVVLFFISSRTGMMVKRAAVGAEGLVLDHYDRNALDRYLKEVGDPLVRACGSNRPLAVFSDSLEVFGSDWTGDILEEFRKRRGYDLKPYLPALVGDIGPETGAIRNDWGQTLTELAEERFLIPMNEWARKHGTQFRSQTYGTPPVALSSNGLVDLPEGEGSQWDRFTTSRWASSAGHLYGRTVISSETWTWLHSPAFRATPLDLKAEADRHFLEGINQLIGHGWPYSPASAGDPGWQFYAAAALNQHNPWWVVMRDVSRYLQRVSFVLRQGKPANDVALYLPTSDARASFKAGQVSINGALERMLGRSLIAQILGAGFGLDFVDDTVIRQHGRIENGALVINGNRFPIVILPNVERMPVETYRRLEAFVRAGGILIATRRTPSLAPGLKEAQTDTAELRAISRRLFEGADARAHFVADEDRGLGPQLAGLFRPDVSRSPPAPEIGFIHRSAGFAEIYFLANTGNTRQRVQATFRVAGMEPEWWDPFDGGVAPARVDARSAEGVTVPLELEPYESRVLVFSRREPVRAQPDAPALSPPLSVVDLSTGWKVTFDGLSSAVRMETLRSWTDDPKTRFYSGQATYERTVAVSEDLLRSGPPLYLEFGEGTAVPEVGTRQQHGTRAWLDSPVREAAVVYVNERLAGSVWRPPYAVEVSRFLHPGENSVRVVVGNLAINRMAASPRPDYGSLSRRYGRRFEAQDMENLQPLPSGLLGPIRLVAASARPGIFSSKEPAAPPRPSASSGGAGAGAAMITTHTE
jgi:hypothetical protein